MVVYDERAYYAQTSTSVEPPAQPWVPLTPASAGASHWDDLDGKPTVFPPEAHTHDAEDVSGAATPLLDVTEASVGAQSVGEALDATTDASRLEGALTGQVDASDAEVTVDFSSQGGPVMGMRLLEWVHVLYAGLAVDLPEALNSKSNVGHTHDGADITGALTDQVDASEALFDVAPLFGLEGPMPRNLVGAFFDFSGVLDWYAPVDHQHAIGDVDGLQGALGDKADADHTHTVADIEATGTRRDDTFLAGDGTWQYLPKNTVTQAAAEAGSSTTRYLWSPQRVRQAADAAISAREWTGTQAQYDAISNKDPNVTYYVLEG